MKNSLMNECNNVGKNNLREKRTANVHVLRRAVVAFLSMLITVLITAECVVLAGEDVTQTLSENMTAQNAQDSTAAQDGQEAAVSQTQDTNTVNEVNLFIDNNNCYEGMGRPYCDGYVPYVDNKTAVIVLPVLSSAPLKNNTLTSSVGLGDTSNTPFVYKNFEKTTNLFTYQVGEGFAECYLIRYDLELKPDRVNGTYPVIITVSGQDANGTALQKEFTVYVTITDGKAPEDEKAEQSREKVTFQPVILIQSNRFSAEEIQSGEEFSVTTEIQNTSDTETVRNMAVTLSAANEAIEITGESNKIFVGDIGAGETREITYNIRTKKEAAEGFYGIELQMNYSDTNATAYTDNGNVRFYVIQPVKLQFDSLVIAPEAQVGDIITASIHAMNLGRSKVYNVRAVISADGLTPEGTIFIGDIEQGQEGNGGVNASVWGLTKDNSRYGNSEGKVICYYEDAAGNESSVEMAFNINIQSPFTELVTGEKKEDKPRQWWVIIAVLAALIAGIGGYVIISGRKWKQAEKETKSEEESNRKEIGVRAGKEEDII